LFKPSILWLVSVLLWQGCAMTHAAAAQTDRPTIGLALSGGGARGFAHIGALKALEELQVPIDYIAGTSIGGIVGGLYASGLSSDELAHAVLEDINWQSIFNRRSREHLSFREKQNQRRFIQLEIGLDKNKRLALPASVVGGHNLLLALKRLSRNIQLDDFTQLPIPFKTVATDLNTARPYILERGELALAMRASMSVPFAFAPVEIDGRVLVDGGLLGNVPADLVKAMGADIVIAIDIGTPLTYLESSSSFLEIGEQSAFAALLENTRIALQQADIIIAPELVHSTTAFDKGKELIAQGYDAVYEKQMLLKLLALSKPAYSAYRTQIAKQRKQLPTFETVKPAFIEFIGQQRTSLKVLQGKVEALVARPLDVRQLEQATQRLMSLNSFEQVTYQLVENNAGETGVRFRVREKPWGPDYFRVGLNVTSSFDDKTEFSLLARHERLDMNALGAEWVNELEFGTGYLLHSEFYQPLDYRKWFFVSPYLRIENRIENLVNAQQVLAEYEFDIFQLGVTAGINFSNVAVLSGSLLQEKNKGELRVGDESSLSLLPSFDYEDRHAVLHFGYDDLDDSIFARRGLALEMTTTFYDDALDSRFVDDNYQEVEFYSRLHIPIHRRATLVADMRVASLLNSESGVIGGFSVGGLNGLAGFSENDVATIGTDAFLIRIGGLFNPPGLARLKLADLRLLNLLHAGNTWTDTVANDADIDLQDLKYGGLTALVWDSGFGTAQFAIGYTEGGDMRYFLSLGNFLR